MKTSGNPKNYSYILERDQPITRGSVIMHYFIILNSALYGVISLLKAYKEGSINLAFLAGVITLLVVFICLSSYFFHNQKSGKTSSYLIIHQGKLRYRWGSLQTEKEVNLDQLNYTTSSPYEIILRFLDRSELIIDNNLLRSHATKFNELKEVLLSYHQKKQKQTNSLTK